MHWQDLQSPYQSNFHNTVESVLETNLLRWTVQCLLWMHSWIIRESWLHIIVHTISPKLFVEMNGFLSASDHFWEFVNMGAIETWTVTPFMVFSVTYPTLRRMLRDTNDQQLHISVIPWHLVFKHAYYFLGLSMFNKPRMVFSVICIIVSLTMFWGVC
jgi:hypothetical protein